MGHQVRALVLVLDLVARLVPAKAGVGVMRTATKSRGYAKRSFGPLREPTKYRPHSFGEIL